MAQFQDKTKPARNGHSKPHAVRLTEVLFIEIMGILDLDKVPLCKGYLLSEL
jgi:hypothetical protein